MNHIEPVHEETLSGDKYRIAWMELYKCFGERMQQEELDLMDSILISITIDCEDSVK